MNPILIIVLVISLGLLLVPTLWIVIIKFLKVLSRKLKPSIFVATGHLVGRKKRGFVSIIGLVSIYAISASSCHVITVLSVMGGFGDDLKQKILGMKAHIIIDSKEGLLNDENRILKIVESIPEVEGAYPYIEEELMVRSSLNISGGVLRGIDTTRASKVMKLGETIIEGKLEYLDHPEKIIKEVFKHSANFLSPIGAIGEVEGEKTKNAKTKTSKESEKSFEKKEIVINRKNTSVQEESKGENSGINDRQSGEELLPAVVIGREMSKNLGAFVGDEIKLISPLGDMGPMGPIPKIRMFRLGAIFFSGMFEYDAKNIYTTLESARSFLGIPEGVTGIEIRIKKPNDAEKISRIIKKRLSSLPASTNLRVRHWKELNRSLFSALLLEKIGMFLMLSLTILIASFSIISTLVMLVTEKTQEISVLKTLGAHNGMIMRIFQFQGFLLGFVGTLVGTGLGILLCWLIKHFGVPINPEVHYIDKLPVKMEPVEITLVAISSLVMCTLITLYPAKIAGKQQIIEGLKKR